MATLKDYLTELKASTEGLGFQCHPDTYQAAIKALEKQMPKKVTTNGFVYFCPECRGSVWQIKPESRFCFRCGQALDWGDTDE